MFVNVLCFYLFGKTSNSRWTQFHADKLSIWALNSHLDPIGDQNHVQYLSRSCVYSTYLVLYLPTYCIYHFSLKYSFATEIVPIPTPHSKSGQLQGADKYNVITRSYVAVVFHAKGCKGGSHCLLQWALAWARSLGMRSMPSVLVAGEPWVVEFGCRQIQNVTHIIITIYIYIFSVI